MIIYDYGFLLSNGFNFFLLLLAFSCFLKLYALGLDVTGIPLCLRERLHEVVCRKYFQCFVESMQWSYWMFSNTHIVVCCHSLTYVSICLMKVVHTMLRGFTHFKPSAFCHRANHYSCKFSNKS